MTEIQRTNIAVANFIIDELYKDESFYLVLDSVQAEALHRIVSDAVKLNTYWNFLFRLTTNAKINNDGISLYISKDNADTIYHMLSSYIAKHDQYGVVRSLGEVS